jgi:hypothetical protein
VPDIVLSSMALAGIAGGNAAGELLKEGYDYRYGSLHSVQLSDDAEFESSS